MADNVSSTIVEQIQQAQNRLEYMLNNHNNFTTMEIVYALGNINSLIALRDALNITCNCAFEDSKQYYLQKRVCEQHPMVDWNEIYEEYWNIPEGGKNE